MASSPITSRHIDGETVQTVRHFFLGSKIAADGDCSHEIKRCLPLERKTMTNLDGILKSRDITLPTKVCLIKTMAFPVVMYGCESWTIKKAERWRTDAFELWCWRRLLSSLDSKEIKPVIPKEKQPWVFIGRTDAKLKLQYFGHLMQRTASLEKILLLGKIEGRRSRGRQRMRWLDGISKLMDISWASSRSWWWTGKPGLLQSMGLQSWTWLTDWTYWLTAPWKKSYDKSRQCIKRQRHQFADKGLYTQSYDFPIVMYGCIHLTIKKAVPQGIDAF